MFFMCVLESKRWSACRNLQSSEMTSLTPDQINQRAAQMQSTVMSYNSLYNAATKLAQFFPEDSLKNRHPDLFQAVSDLKNALAMIQPIQI